MQKQTVRDGEVKPAVEEKLWDLHRILSSAFESAKMMMPAKSSRASISPKIAQNYQKRHDIPLLSVSKMANICSLIEKIVSNSVRFTAKLSQIDLKPPCNSLILARDRFMRVHEVFRSPCIPTCFKKFPIFNKTI